MTREEAIEILERKTTIPDTNYTWAQIDQAIDTAISALRSVSREQELETENKELKERIVNWRKYMAPTREQVEKVWRSDWIHPHWSNDVHCMDCKRCGKEAYHRLFRGVRDYYLFCPHCGAPLTDEAVEMVMERLEVVCSEAKAD